MTKDPLSDSVGFLDLKDVITPVVCQSPCVLVVLSVRRTESLDGVLRHFRRVGPGPGTPWSSVYLLLL